jgi:hypothetical protein
LPLHLHDLDLSRAGLDMDNTVAPAEAAEHVHAIQS